MLIDWFTTVAQIINFLILVWLMKRFLYGPIIKAMDDREQAIAARLREAEEKNAEAVREAAAYREKQHDLDLSRDALLGKAVEEASTRREELVREAREETDRLRSRWTDALRQEKESLIRDLRYRVAQRVCDATRRVLAEMADAELERLVVRSFLRRLETVDEVARSRVGAALTGREEVTVRSAFRLPEEERAALLEVLERRFGARPTVSWAIDLDLLCGLELTVQGHQVAWSFEEFVRDLEQDLERLLEEAAR